MRVLTKSALCLHILSGTGTVLNRKVRGWRPPAEMLEQGVDLVLWGPHRSLGFLCGRWLQSLLRMVCPVSGDGLLIVS